MFATGCSKVGTVPTPCISWCLCSVQILMYNFSMTTNVNIQEINNGLSSNVKLRDNNAVHYFFLMTLTCVVKVVVKIWAVN